MRSGSATCTNTTIPADAVHTLGNILDNFLPGKVYNIGGTEYHDMKRVSDMILNYLGQKDDLVEYVELEPWTTRDKKVDVSRATQDLGHSPKVLLEEGIPRIIEWMRGMYREAGMRDIPPEAQ